MRAVATAALALGLLVPAAPTHATAAPTAAPTDPAAALARMSLRQEVGQLLMLGAPSTSAPARITRLIGRYDVGSVVLIGTTHAGSAAVAGVTSALQSAAGPVRLFVAADQEGGQVQHLQGPGFGRLPSALTMGGQQPSQVRSRAATTALQLRRAGVNLDLAPVLDTVPRANRYANQPIGRYDREFGFTPHRVATRGVAFAKGLADGGVSAALKHFPGLGRVRGNTDDSSGVVDHTTTAHDRYLRPFRRGIAAGAPFVMISSAVYARIDQHRPAVFSRTVITTLLRQRLGFGGVVVSDSLSAAQVARWSAAKRAVRFVRAGGDIALTTSASDVPRMSDALVAAARRSRSFRQLVDAAALRVLQAKQRQGLL
jgi:beta-N-acetylhexosaminidase